MPIKKLQGRDHIRLRPSMYIGRLGTPSKVFLIKEILACAQLETGRLESFYEIKRQSDDQFQISIKAKYDFAALLKKLEHDKSKFNWRFCLNYNIAKALSKNFKAESKKNELLISYRFDQNYNEEKLDFEKLIFGLKEFAFLNPMSKILVSDHTADYLIQQLYHFPEGIFSQVDHTSNDCIYDPKIEITYTGTVGDRDLIFYFGIKACNQGKSTVYTYANDDRTKENGSVLDGVVAGVLSAARKFINQNNLEEDYSVKKRSLMNHLILHAAIRGENIIYDGGTKWAVGEPKLKRRITKIVKVLLLGKLENNSEQANEFIRMFRNPIDPESIDWPAIFKEIDRKSKFKNSLN